MWTLIIIGIVFLAWYFIAPPGEVGAAAEAAPAPEPEAPAADAPAENHAVTDGSEFSSAQPSDDAGGAAPAEEPPAQAGGSDDDDPFKAH